MKFRSRVILLLALAGSLHSTAACAQLAGGMALSYRLTPGKTLRYKLTAKMSGAVPLFDSLTPVPIEDAVLTIVYQATPKAAMPDGSADVSFVVESAEVEIQQAPLPLPLEDVQKMLNQVVTFTRSGEVKAVKSPGATPFHLSIPGVDPARLYALIFPVVFQAKPVAPGDTWTFDSVLVKGEGAKPTFTATILGGADAGASVVRIGERFDLPVDVTVDAHMKPVAPGAQPYKTRKGKISGSGTLQFDRSLGLFTKSEIDIKAKIAQDLIGQPQSPDDPKHIDSHVDAHVTVELQPSGAAAASADQPEKASGP